MPFFCHTMSFYFMALRGLPRTVRGIQGNATGVAMGIHGNAMTFYGTFCSWHALKNTNALPRYRRMEFPWNGPPQSHGAVERFMFHGKAITLPWGLHGVSAWGNCVATGYHAITVPAHGIAMVGHATAMTMTMPRRVIVLPRQSMAMQG